MEPSSPPCLPPPSSRAWSIYARSDITAHYTILSRIGSGAYSDVYLARRNSDSLTVALKEIHDYQSSSREIQALQALHHCPNVITLLDYFWNEENDDDAVLVLEYLESDLERVIRERKRSGSSLGVGEVKGWMVQILRGVDACHRNGIVHRDLKPGNLLVSGDGVLKLADFGQARILQGTRFFSIDDSPLLEQRSESGTWACQQPTTAQDANQSSQDGTEDQTVQQPNPISEDDYLQEVESLKAKYPMDDTDKESNLQDGDTSCLATCSTGDLDEDPFKGSYSYEAAGLVDGDESGALTSCVGTRWFRAPELLYGSTNYGQEVDLWSLGCIFAELLSLEPLFPGTSDLDQLVKIISILGNMNEGTCPGCSHLPDYSKISFNKVESPLGLEARLPNRSDAEVNLVRKLVFYDPASRATAMELLGDRYFGEDPLPLPPNELRVPSVKDGDDASSTEEWGDYRDMGSDSELDFVGMDVVTTEKGFSMRFL